MLAGTRCGRCRAVAELFLTHEAVDFMLREGQDIVIIYNGKLRRVVDFHGTGSLRLEPLPGPPELR